MRIKRIGGSRLHTDSKVWGLDQTTWELMWAGEAATRKNIPALRQAGFESIWARGSSEAKAPPLAARHSQPARVHTDSPPKTTFFHIFNFLS